MGAIRIMVAVGAMSLATACSSFGFLGSNQPSGTPPPPPSWVNANGTVNTSRVPPYVPVSDAQGNVAGYVKSKYLFGDPDVADGPAPVYATDHGGRVVGCFDEQFIPMTCKELRDRSI